MIINGIKDCDVSNKGSSTYNTQIPNLVAINHNGQLWSRFPVILKCQIAWMTKQLSAII